MKALALVLLALSSSAFAQDCFKAEIPADFASSIPSKICISKLQFVADKSPELGKILIEANSNSTEFPAARYYDSLDKFLTKSTIGSQTWGGMPCSDFGSYSIELSFLSDTAGKLIGKPSILAFTAYNVDVCHSQTKRQVIEFQAIEE